MNTEKKLNSIQYEVLNPRGTIPQATLTPLVTRVPDLNDKVVYIVNTRKPHAEETMLSLANFVRERFPQVKLNYVMKKTSYRDDEPELWDEVGAKADAAIVGPGD